MSDGNYNRSLLPADRYASGLRAGEARMRTRALGAFERWLRQVRPALSEEEVCTERERFHGMLG